ncbi:MAG TPA: TIGR01841 family phasin [Rhodoblastus sp.]|nr:TIGR01841 family phasin [Rhodoblastus sp.]
MAVRRPAKPTAAPAKAAVPAKTPEAPVKTAPAPAKAPAVVKPAPVKPPAPAAAKPVAKPAEPKPAVAAKAAEAAPVVAKPAEAKPAAEPVAAKPVAPKPAAAKSADAPIKAIPVAAVDMSGVQDNLRKAASKTLEQGRAAFERMKEASDEATQTIEASFAASSKGASELASKALEVAKVNANATFDHLKALAGAKTLADAVSLHGQFIRAQSEAAIAQAKEFAELARKAATDAAAPIQAQIKKAQAK